ncbi:hypothetical protein ACFL1H_06030, partial [Nanoarchaeota archaeon]
DKNLLKDVKSRIEVSAVVFCDSILNEIKDKQNKNYIKSEIQNQKYFEASIAAIKALSEEATIEKLKEYLK